MQLFRQKNIKYSRMDAISFLSLQNRIENFPTPMRWIFNMILHKKLKLVCLLLMGCCCMMAQTTEFEEMVAKRYLDTKVKDVSDDDEITIPEPKIAYVNLTGFEVMPANQKTDLKGWMEVYDGNGIYFKKPVVISAQGNYSLKFPKKNFVCDFCDETWNEDKGADFKIGNWVKQSSFHFKAFYTDFLRGIGEVGYKVYAGVVADRAPYWERVGYHDESMGRCFPDGFPCAVYLNGDFYGVFAWQLKKSRKNMNMQKEVAEHIHLDGTLKNETIFRGNIQWGSFEVRNPKGLYDKNGNKYKGDSPKELMDDNNKNYEDETDTPDVIEAKERTSKVKKYIVAMSKYWSELNTLEKGGLSKEEMRKEIEKRYEIESLLDYCVFFYFSANGDGSLKNWQWFTYDGIKWMVTPYDLDQTFGINLYAVVRPPTMGLDILVSGPFYWIQKYYQDDLQRRYGEVRDRGVFNAEYICRIIDDWYERVGGEYYAMEKAKWPESPCYCEAECNPGWEVYDKWDNYADTEDYNVTRTYNAGTIVKLEGRLWRATKTVHGVRPYKVNANIDTIERLRAWVAGRINFLDDFYDYDPKANDITSPAFIETPRQLIGIYTTSGIQVDVPTHGLYIYLYSDGTIKRVLIR